MPLSQEERQQINALVARFEADTGIQAVAAVTDKADAYPDKNPSPFVYERDTDNPGVDDGHIVSNAVRVKWQATGKDQFSVYHDDQAKYRNHWGIAATIPPVRSNWRARA